MQGSTADVLMLVGAGGNVAPGGGGGGGGGGAASARPAAPAGENGAGVGANPASPVRDAHVRFTTPDAANRAVVEANNLVIDGKAVLVQHALVVTGAACRPPLPPLPPPQLPPPLPPGGSPGPPPPPPLLRPPADWAPQSRPTTVVCRWTIPTYRQCRTVGSKTGVYHESVFEDVAGNRWRLYYFVNGDGTDSEHHLSLYLSVDEPGELPFGWSKDVTFAFTVEHASDPRRDLSRWDSKRLKSVPPPKETDWGWHQFASHEEVESHGCVLLLPLLPLLLLRCCLLLLLTRPLHPNYYHHYYNDYSSRASPQVRARRRGPPDPRRGVGQGVVDRLLPGRRRRVPAVRGARRPP
jgi:hypothetical protein